MVSKTRRVIVRLALWCLVISPVLVMATVAHISAKLNQRFENERAALYALEAKHGKMTGQQLIEMQEGLDK